MQQKPFSIILIRIFTFLFILTASSQCEQENRSNQNILAGLFLLQSGILTPGTPESACPSASLPDGVHLADTVTSAPASGTGDYKDSTKAVNGICGAGLSSGGTDVFSLDATGSGAELVLEWSGKKVINESGVDFIVFENAFQISSATNRYFMEPAIVEVGIDGSSYCGFSPDFAGENETTYSDVQSSWKSFAGTNPVLFNQNTSSLSADEIFTDSDSNGMMDYAGGNGFNLDDLTDHNAFSTGCTEALMNNIKTGGFVYLRIVSAISRDNPDASGSKFPVNPDSFDGAPDIDGVLAQATAPRG